MDNIDYGQWTVPTSWDEITLKMFSDIERYYSDKEKKFDAREVLQIFTNKSVDEINELPIEFTEMLMSKLAFLQEKPHEQEATNKIVVDGETYIINIMEKLKTGEYVAIDTILKADKYDYASILAVICRKEGEVYDSKYEAELFDKRKEMWENQSVVNIFPTIAFFFNLYFTLRIPSQLYSEVEEGLNHIQRHIETSDKIGVFRRHYLNWQMRRLRKLLKSSKST